MLRSDQDGCIAAKQPKSLLQQSPSAPSMVARAEVWRWSGLWRHVSGDAEARSLLARRFLPRPRNWVELVNAPQTEAELKAIRRAVRRSSPFGDPKWQEGTARGLGLEATLRPRKDVDD